MKGLESTLQVELDERLADFIMMKDTLISLLVDLVLVFAVHRLLTIFVCHSE